MKFREYKVMCFSKCWKKKAWLEKAGFLCNRTRREKEYMCRQHAHASCRTDLRISQLCQQDNRTQAMLTKVHLFPDCGWGKGESRRETLRGLPSVHSDWGVHISFNLLPSWGTRQTTESEQEMAWCCYEILKREEIITLTQTKLTPDEQVWINLSSAPRAICCFDRLA